MISERIKLAAPCGLYCGICNTFLEGICHGCGCQAEDCFAAEKHRVCAIYRCVLEKGLQDCSSCDDFPCTQLIQFAFDPLMRTHLPVLNNLAKRRKIGIAAWTKKQKTYWKDNQEKFNEWISFHQECKRKRRQIQEH